MKISKYAMKTIALALCLIMAISLLPVSALAVPPDVTAPSEGGLGLSKTVTSAPDQDGIYELTLNTYTTGKVTTQTQAVPTDVVLVLDQSGSMGDSFGTTTRQAAMKSSVVTFINSVAAKFSASANHKVGIVTFGGSGVNLIGMTAVDNAGKTALIQKVNNLPTTPSGATNVGDGMAKANAMLPAAVAGRNRIVVVFTDGVPTKNSDFDVSVANAAISTAKTMKAAGVNVFTIGIFQDAKVSQLHGDYFYYTNFADVPCSGAVDSVWGASWVAGMSGDIKSIDIPAGNRFLNYLSSNAPQATAIGIQSGRYHPNHTGFAGGDGWKITANSACDTNAGYYLTATNTEGLNNVFQTISGSITTPDISLDSTTVVRDILTDTFKLSASAAKPIKVFKVPYTGKNTWGTPVDITSSVTIITAVDGTIDVKGFDFNANMVYDNANKTFGGAKLQIIIPIKVKDGATIAANQVPTNTANSGIISNGSNVGAFPIPEVTLYKVNFVDYDGSVIKSQLVSPAKGATAPAQPTRGGYNFTGWDKEFSNITQDTVITAVYEKDSSMWHTVTFIPSANSTLAGASSDGKVVKSDILVGSAWDASWVPGVTYATGYMAGADAWDKAFPATVTEDLTFTATQSKDNSKWFTVTFVPSANSTLTGADSDGKVIIIDVCKDTDWNTAWVPAVTYSVGYKAGDPAWDAEFPAKVTDNLTFTATEMNNASDRFSVNFSAGSHGTLVGTTSFTDIITGTLFTAAVSAIPTPNPEAGYKFEKWTPVLPGQDGTVTENMSFVASFVKDETKWHTVSFSANYGGSLGGTTSFSDILDGSVFSGSVTVPTPIAQPGFRFVGWNPALPETDSTVNSNQVYSAMFEQKNYPINSGSAQCFKVVSGVSTVPSGYKANFELYRIADGEDQLVAVGHSGTFEGNKAPIVFELSAPAAVSAMDAVKAKDMSLPAGSYRLVETSAPDIGGYTKSAPTYTNEGIVVLSEEGTGVVCTNSYTVNGTPDIPPYFPPVIPDEEVPLGPPALNRTDHFAYIVGRSSDKVAPNAQITRAEVATIFFRMLTDKSRIELWSSTNSFNDVGATHWFNNAVSTLAKAGILDGYADGSFKPNAPITRAEFSAIATRFYDAPGQYASDAFNDISNHWARNYINRAAELKLVSGYDNGSFKPDSNITRAEAIQMVNSILGRTPNKDHLLTGMKTWKDNADTNAWFYAAVQEATNNHDYKIITEIPLSYEQWTKLLPIRDWEKLETQWAVAAAAAGK